MRILLIAAIVLTATEVARAQWQDVANQARGMFGSRSLGSSIGNRGSTAFGSASSRSGRGAGTSVGGGAAGNVGQIDSSSRFVRGNRQAGQFVGRDAQDMRDFVGALTGGRSGNRNTRSGLSSSASRRAGGANQPGRRSSGRNASTEVRTTLRVAFEYAGPENREISSTLAARLTNSPHIRVVRPLEVLVQQRTAILRGAVLAERDRELAGQVARLEAGISDVKNELTVVEPIQKHPAVKAPGEERPPAARSGSGSNTRPPVVRRRPNP